MKRLNDNYESNLFGLFFYFELEIYFKNKCSFDEACSFLNTKKEKIYIDNDNLSIVFLSRPEFSFDSDENYSFINSFHYVYATIERIIKELEKEVFKVDVYEEVFYNKFIKYRRKNTYTLIKNSIFCDIKPKIKRHYYEYVYNHQIFKKSNYEPKIKLSFKGLKDFYKFNTFPFKPKNKANITINQFKYYLNNLTNVLSCDEITTLQEFSMVNKLIYYFLNRIFKECFGHKFLFIVSKHSLSPLFKNFDFSLDYKKILNECFSIITVSEKEAIKDYLKYTNGDMNAKVYVYKIILNYQDFAYKKSLLTYNNDNFKSIFYSSGIIEVEKVPILLELIKSNLIFNGPSFQYNKESLLDFLNYLLNVYSSYELSDYDKYFQIINCYRIFLIGTHKIIN